MNESTTADVTAKWMVGDRLACVLHVGDTALAYRLADQGHDVVVLGAEVSVRRHPDIGYVRCEGDRLPFVSSAFDAVVVPHLDESALAMSEYARVLSPGGLLSTQSTHHDESIPWLRKLREIIGMRDDPVASVGAVNTSGLFHAPDVTTSGAWEKLDLDALMRFARANRHPSVPDAAMTRVRDLFAEYAAQTGFLQLRHETHCVRARIDKSQLEAELEAPETVLLDLR